MTSGASALLAGGTAKQKAEAANFQAFWLAHQNFAGRRLVRVEWGGDPPDVLCFDEGGKRIGVELVQWVNERQMAASKARQKLEDSYRVAIRSEDEQPPRNIGMIFVHPKDKTLLSPKNTTAFRRELHKLVGVVDAAWLSNPEWDDPQGHTFTNFCDYPCLEQRLERLIFFPRGAHSPRFGHEWITFEMQGCAYTPAWMHDALLDNIRRKIAKYAKPNNKLKLQQQQLAEFYLLAYYDEAVLHNTPYRVPRFRFQEIGANVGRELAAIPHPFTKVFLYSPIEKTSVTQVWPTFKR